MDNPDVFLEHLFENIREKKEEEAILSNFLKEFLL
jgi:hypothetical protein